MRAERFSVIGGEDYDGVVCQAAVVQCREQPPDTFIYSPSLLNQQLVSKEKG